METTNSTLTQMDVQTIFESNGITASSSGNCTDPNRKNCTSYEGLRSSVVNGVVGLKQQSGATIVITGGTEIGHASGTYSHSNGYKVDLRHNKELDNYIKSTFTEIAKRGGKYPQWKGTNGDTYCDEGNHWDITFTK